MIQFHEKLCSSLFTWQLFNVLFIIRCILKFFTETIAENQLIEEIVHNSKNGSRLEDFIGALVAILVDVPVDKNTYGIHLESITILLVLLSVPLHSDGGNKSDQSAIYRLIMLGKHVIHAPLLIKSLLTNYIKYEGVPVGFGGQSGHSLVFGIAAELWSILTFKKPEEGAPLDQGSYQEAPLATQSGLLLLVLVHHWTTKANPYRISLFSCINSEGDFLFCFFFVCLCW